ncbi:MAG TPA: Uma2 family endonuclease [Mycobacteriales bacterium]|nr:Uma2 family endonuclease [Mycobacteriales bacterium]
MSSVVPQHRGPWHFDELADLPEDGRRYEVVDGALHVTPPPGHLHQAVGADLLAQLARQCAPPWRVAYEWPLPLGTDGRVPDLAVVRSDAPVRGAGPYPVGSEQVGLVVEIVSPSSRKTDRFAKPGEYAEAGIPLFWRVETDPDVVLHAFRLVDGGYVETAVVRDAGEVDVPWGRARVGLPELR